MIVASQKEFLLKQTETESFICRYFFSENDKTGQTTCLSNLHVLVTG